MACGFHRTNRAFCSCATPNGNALLRAVDCATAIARLWRRLGYARQADTIAIGAGADSAGTYTNADSYARRYGLGHAPFEYELPCLGASASISLQRYTSLTFASPLALLQAPGSDSHWYVIEQEGTVRRFSASAPTSATTVLDIKARVRSGGEMGLLGMAFHPTFPTDPRVFLSYTTLEGSQLVSHISSFVSGDGGATLDSASETVLLAVNQPAENHNGGHIAFGPDGFLSRHTRRQLRLALS